MARDLRVDDADAGVTASVVIRDLGDAAATSRCLAAIEGQSHPVGATVIVGADADLGAAIRASTGDLVALVDADRIPGRRWLSSLVAMGASPATAVVVGRTVDGVGPPSGANAEAALAARWRATHRSLDLGDLPVANPRGVRGGNAAVRRAVAARLLGDGPDPVIDPVAALARRAPGFGLVVRYAPDAVATRAAPSSLRAEVAAYVDERVGGGLSARGAVDGTVGILDDVAAAMAADVASGANDLAYVTCLVAVVATLRSGVGAGAVARSLSRPGGFSPGMADAAASDAASLVAGTPTAPVGTQAAVEASFARWIDDRPRAWWRRLSAGREAVAAAMGWAATDGGAVAGPEAWWPGTWRVAARALPAIADDLVAVLATGRPGTAAGEASFLAVTRIAPAADRAASWLAHLDRATGVRCLLRTVGSDDLGWLPPSREVAEAVANGTCLWGAGAVLAVLPAWPPGAIPVDDAFHAVDDAHAALDAGDATRARRLAVEALLFARGAFDPDEARQAGALARSWPGAASTVDETPATVAVARAQAEVHRWRFTWEGDGPGEAAIARWREMREARRPRSDPFATGDAGGEA